MSRVTVKFERQQKYAERELTNFARHRFQFWSPNVPKGQLTERLATLGPALELVINGEYARRVDGLRAAARQRRNAVFRVLQILEHLRFD